MPAIGTIAAGIVIANLRTRYKQFTDKDYPSLLLLRDINIAISNLIAEGNLDADDYNVEWTVPNTLDTVELSIFADYKQLKDISHIQWSGGLADNVSEKEFEVQKSYGASGIYRESVIWYRKGYRIYFYKGTGVTSYNTRVIFANRLPIPVTTVDDILDLKDDKISLLENKIEMKYKLIDVQNTNQKLVNIKVSDKENKLAVKEK